MKMKTWMKEWITKPFYNNSTLFTVTKLENKMLLVKQKDTVLFIKYIVK